mgnify:CR=1 FL=1
MYKRKIALVATLCISLLLVSILATVNASEVGFKEVVQNSIISKYFNFNENQLKSELKKIKTKELIEEINSFSSDVSNSELIPFVSELFERKNELNDKDILSKIKDNSNSVRTQEIMVDLYIEKKEGISDQSEIKQLLKDTTIRKEVKSRIVLNSKFDNGDLELLKELIVENKDILAFNSLKKLSKVNKREAYLISKEILSNLESESKLRISAAQKSAAKFLRSSDDTKAKKEFISQTMKIIDNSETDLMLKDSSVFALSEIMSKESIIAIIKSESIDKELKAFSIEQNYHVLKKMLQTAPSEDDIRIVIKAMEILPIVDLYDDLKDVNATIKNQDLKNRCSKVIDTIKVNGIKATQKWLD